MGAFIDQQSADALLHDIADNAGEMHLVSDSETPVDVSNSLGHVAMTKGSGNGDYLVEAGQYGGDDRQLTVSSKSITASATGTARHIVLWDEINSRIKAAIPITEKAVTSGTVYDISAFAVYEYAPYGGGGAQ